MNYNERIKQLRIEFGLSQAELASRLDVSKGTMSKYEAGSVEPSVDTFLKMATIFSVSLDYLLGSTDERFSRDDWEWRYSHSSNRFGEIMRRYRADSKITQSELAQTLHISVDLYHDLEAGRYTPNFELLKRISSITHIELDFLTGAIDFTFVQKNSGASFAMGEFSFKSRFEELCARDKVDSETAQKKIGISKENFSDIQFNRMPTLSELLKMSYAFGVSIDYLVGKSDVPLIGLSQEELELVLSYRDCLSPYQKNLLERARYLSAESALSSLDNQAIN